jgi:hypothetical protein
MRQVLVPFPTSRFDQRSRSPIGRNLHSVFIVLISLAPHFLTLSAFVLLLFVFTTWANVDRVLLFLFI